MSARVSLQGLSTLCRSLSTLLESGVELNRAFKVVTAQATDARLQRVLETAGLEVRKGESLSDAFRVSSDRLPPLFLEMVTVSEQAGALPETMHALADHYEHVVALRRTFIGALVFPILQLLAAIFIVAGLLVVLGWIADSGNGEPIDFFFGLKGVSGALTWLTGWVLLVVGGYVGYSMLATSLSGLTVVHRLLLSLPVVGDCLTSFAVARFAWAYSLTQQAGLDVLRSLDSSLRATGNAAFQAAVPHVQAAVTAGEELNVALEETALFPRDVIELVRVGETSGTVPETLQRLSPVFEERARRSLATLTTAAGWLIWAMVAGLIIFLIMRVAMVYVGMLNDAASGAL